MGDIAWGEPQFEVERLIDEFGVIRMTDEFYNCRRIVCQVVVDRLPFNYYENSKNRQPPNQFYGKLTVFNNGFLREEIPITHLYEEFDIDTDVLLLNDAFLSTVCRVIWHGIYLHKIALGITTTDPISSGVVEALGEFDDWLAALQTFPPPDFPLFPTRRIGFPRFDEVRVKFIEPGVRGKLRLLGWKNMSQRMCCSGTISEPNEPPDEPPRDPPDEDPPVPPDFPDEELPPPDPPYDGGTDDDRTKPPPEEPPFGTECEVYEVRVTSEYLLTDGSGGTFQQTDLGFMYGELGRISINRSQTGGADNIFIQSRGNQSNGEPCGTYQDYGITGYPPNAEVRINRIISATVNGSPYDNVEF